MGHQISQTNGIYSYADSRTRNGKTDAWHQLGQPVGHAMTAKEALEAALLANWNVRKRPVYANLGVDDQGEGVDKYVEVPDQYVTVFNNPVTGRLTPIGVVGKRYTPIQNEALVEFADALVDESGAHYETAGSLYGYRKVFLTMKLPRELKFVGLDGTEDISEWYLALFNSHDGSSALFGVITSVRVVCANTAAAAIQGAKSRFAIPHTSGWRSSVQVAREQLRIAWDYEQAFEEQARALYEQPFGTADLDEFLEELLATEEVGASSTALARRRNEAAAIRDLFVSSPTISGTPIAGTRFGAYSAVTEYVDHYAPVRGGGGMADIARATRTLLHATTETGLKHRAWKLLTAN